MNQTWNGGQFRVQLVATSEIGLYFLRRNFKDKGNGECVIISVDTLDEYEELVTFMKEEELEVEVY